MPLWQRYWTVTLLWALGAAGLSTLHHAWTNAVGPYADGWFGAWASVRVLPTSLALFVPLTAFAGAVAAARLANDAGTRSSWSRTGLCIACGVVTFALAAHAAPWLERLAMQAALAGSGVTDAAWQAQSRAYWHDLYEQLLGAAHRAAAAGDPDASGELGLAYGAGLRYHLPLVAGVVGALMTALGLLVGARTRTLGRPLLALAHEWGVALVVVAGIALGFRAARLLSGRHAVPPELTAPLVALVPALLVVALLWTRVVSHDAERSAVLPATGTPHDR